MPEVLMKFEGTTAALEAFFENDERQLATLTDLRDIPLPKLLSGGIRIKAADQAVDRALA